MREAPSWRKFISNILLILAMLLFSVISKTINENILNGNVEICKLFAIYVLESHLMRKYTNWSIGIWSHENIVWNYVRQKLAGHKVSFFVWMSWIMWYCCFHSPVSQLFWSFNKSNFESFWPQSIRTAIQKWVLIIQNYPKSIYSQ